MSDEPREPALDRAIQDDPYDVENYRVYADWLDEREDPRAKLIRLHLLAEQLTDKPKLAHLVKRTAEYFDAHRDRFLGKLARHVATDAMPRTKRNAIRHGFTWRFGFLHAAKLSEYFPPPKRNKIDEVLDEVLHHPSGRFLADLEMMWPTQELVNQLEPHVPRSLRSLRFNGAGELDVSALLRAAPRLQRLSLDGHCNLGELDLPELRYVRLDGATAIAAPDSLASARMPLLEHLEFGTHLELVVTLRPLFDRTDLPALTRISLDQQQITPELLEQFSTWPLMKQLRRLDLVSGNMLDDDAIAWAAIERPMLDILDVTGNPLSQHGVTTLARIAKQVIF